MKNCQFTLMVGVMGAALMPIVGSATIYNAATDFSTSSNPNGVWAYGWSSTLGSSFNLDTTVIQDLGGVAGVVQWQGNQPPNADGNPSVFENTAASAATIGQLPCSLVRWHFILDLPANTLSYSLQLHRREITQFQPVFKVMTLLALPPQVFLCW